MLSKKYKIALVVTLAAMLVVDVAAMGYLIAKGLVGWYLEFPIIFAIFDLFYLLATVFSNQRFSYTKWYIAVYAAATLIMALAWLTTTLVSTGKIFSVGAWTWWFVLHVGGVLVAVITFVYAQKRNISAIVAGIAAASIAVASIVYLGIMFANGYFGQGGQRTLVYEYIDDDKCRVTGVLDGNGGDVTVPSEFNGKKVVGVSANIFNAKGVNNVTLSCSTDVEFTDVEKLNSLPASLNIYTVKSELETFKQKLYQMSAGDNAFKLGNRLSPYDLDEGEVCVTFAYDALSYSLAEEVTIPTWYGKKGDTFAFDLPAIEKLGADYALFTDKWSDSDLWWGYSYLGGYIMSDLRVNDGLLVGAKINDSIYSVPVSFEKIYRVYPGTSNDKLYPMSRSFEYSKSESGAMLAYRLTVASNADRITAPFERDGFTLVWKDGINTFDSLKYRLDELTANSITISPSWKLIAPKVELTANNGASIVYGDPFGLSATASHDLDDVEFEYTWSKYNEQIGTGSSYSVDSMPIDGGGKYRLQVVASAPHITSLTADVVRELDVAVSRRTLTAKWVDPQSDVYDGTQKTVSVYVDDIVAGDDVSLDKTSFVYTDANLYLETVKLTGDTADRYILEHATHSFRLQPKGVKVTWSDTDFTYTGYSQAPKASADGINGPLNVKVVGGRTDACTGAIAYASIDDKNYTISEGQSCVFDIKQRGVTVFWSGDPTHVYDGNEFAPTASATGLDGALVVNVDGKQTDANTDAMPRYTATASLADNNYKINVGATQTFTITPRPVTVDWGSREFTYNGNAQVPTATAMGINDTTLTLDVAGAQTNVGSDYVATASLRDADSRNYTISGSAVSTFDIAKMKVLVVWSGGARFTYNGKPQAPTATAKGANSVTLTLVVSGAQTDVKTEGSNIAAHIAYASLSAADSANYELIKDTVGMAFFIEPRSAVVRWGVANHTYDGNAWAPSATFTDVDGNPIDLTVSGAQTNAGSYTATASTTDANYTLTNSSTPFSIAKMKVTVVWGATTHEYDGKAWAPTATASGAENATLTLDVAGAQTNAGSYTATAVLKTADSANYVISGGNTTAFVITKKAVTVTVGSATVKYGAALPKLDYTVSGLVGNDTLAVTVTVVGATEDDNGNIPVGEYDVTATTNDPQNYAVTVVNGKLTVESDEQEV